MNAWKNMPVKHQYSIVQMLYWITCSMLAGYGVLYLQYRGLSSTMIGVVVGGGAGISIAAQPLIAQLTEKIKCLTVKRMLQLLIICMIGLFICLTILPLSEIGVMVLYTLLYMLNTCVPPFLSAMGMEFFNRGYYLDFGISRGLGSIAYASFAAVLGILIEKTYPGIMGYVYLVWAVLLLISISMMEDLDTKEKTVKQAEYQKSEVSMVQIIRANPVMFWMMVGFCLMNMGNQAAVTYMVDIINNLGGSNSVLGIANFVSAASEMPVMLLFAYFLSKASCIRLLKISSLFYVLKLIVLLCAGNLPMAILGLGMQGLCFGLFTPAAVYYVNSTIEPDKRVKGQAVFSMITSGAATCGGNFMGGWLQDLFGLKMLLVVCTALVALGAMIVVVLPDKTKYTR